MRLSFGFLLLVTIIFGFGFFYHKAAALCPIPIAYRIGVLDDRFELSFDDAKQATAEAEAAWESAVGQDLFVYDEAAEFSINFVFDERQLFYDAKETYLERLDQTEDLNLATHEEFTALLDEFESKRATFATKWERYQSNLATFEAKVASYEAEGVPSEVRAELVAEQEEIDRQYADLQTDNTALNQLSQSLNDLQERGSQILETYNQGVRVFNNSFVDTANVNHGLYQGDQINIFTFNSSDELFSVLTHEMGHLLLIEHIESDESAIMHPVLKSDTRYEVLESDVAAFHDSLCGVSMWQRMGRLLLQLPGSTE